MSVTLQEQLEEVNREIEMRKRIYPKWIREQKITPERADSKMRAIKAVAETLRILVEKHEGT